MIAAIEEPDSSAKEMKNDLDAFRGIAYSILLSLPFWVVVILLLLLFGVLG